VPVRDDVLVFAATLYLTVPFPLPLAPALIVIHEMALLVAVQVQPEPAVTLTVPVVAADDVRFDDVGEIVNVHGAAAWVTVNVCPAMLSVPVREVVAVFAPTLYATEPEPLPLAPEVIVIHAALLAAVHVQPVAAVTVTLPVAAADVVRLEEVGAMLGAHVRLNANVFERALAAVPPGPTALTTDS